MSNRRYPKLDHNPSENKAVQGVGYSQNIKLFQFLMNEYAGVEFILNIAESTIDFLKRFKTKNKGYQATLNLLKYGIPAVVLISEFFAKLKKFRMIRSGKNTVSNEREEKVRGLMGIKNEKVYIDNFSFNIGAEVSRWILRSQKTKSFKIIGYYQYDTLQPIQDTYKEDGSTLLTLIEYQNKKYVWMFKMLRGPEGASVIECSSVFADVDNRTNVNGLKGDIYKEFLQHFDFKSNVLLLSPYGLNAIPRQVVTEKPRNFDIKKFSMEINKTLKRGKKRGWVFVGLPGTGKSTIIHSLEMAITDYPIVYLCTECFHSNYTVQETFNTLKYLQPCIAITEDLDSCGLKDKNPVLGEYLEQVDDVDNKLNIVLVASINDTGLVHYSLINRPGRYDEVVMIKPPQEIEDIYDIMKCRYEKNRKTDPEITEPFLSINEIDKKCFDTILLRKFTQADICEIIEKSLLIENHITNENLVISIKNLEESKLALKECNFGGHDPYSCIDDKKDDPDITEGAPMEPYRM